MVFSMREARPVGKGTARVSWGQIEGGEGGKGGREGR